MGRGRKPTRGGRRTFTDVETLKKQHEEIRSGRRNQESDDSDDDNQPQVDINRQGAVGELPPSDSDEYSSDEEGAGDDKPKQKAAATPAANSMVQRDKKLKDLTLENLDISDERRGLNRKEREALAKEEAKKRYQAATAAGKTDEAKADLARLAIIREKRAEDAKRRELEAQLKAKEAEAKAKADKERKAKLQK